MVSKSIPEKVLILCEDSKSSLNYLYGFREDERLKRDLTFVEIDHPDDFSPMGLVTEALNRMGKAKRKRNPYTEVWIVLDKDQHAKLPEAINLAKTNNINVGLSVVCFEVWLILHYRKCKPIFYNADETISYLKREHLSSYEKCAKCYEMVKDKIQDAINNGKWLEKENQNDLDRGMNEYQLSAYTNLHKLVEKLSNPLAHWKVIDTFKK